jgi:hypothetical protein
MSGLIGRISTFMKAKTSKPVHFAEDRGARRSRDYYVAVTGSRPDVPCAVAE